MLCPESTILAKKPYPPDFGQNVSDIVVSNCSKSMDGNALAGLGFTLFPPDEASACFTCLMSQKTVKDILFGSHDTFLETLYLRNPFALSTTSNLLFDTDLGLFVDCDSRESCWQQNAMKHNFGLGGSAEIMADSSKFADTFSAFFAQIGVSLPPANQSTPGSISQAQYTGQGDPCFSHFSRENCRNSKVKQFNKWMGNTSTTLWSNNISVRGALDLEPQFHPWVEPSDNLTLWIPDLMREFPMVYQANTTYREISTLRFSPSDTIFALNGQKHESQYNQTNTNPGSFDFSAVTSIKFGSKVPVVLTQPLFLGADREDPFYSSFDCVERDMTSGKNVPCRDPSEELDGSFVDIEPTFGKVLNGKAQGQMNVRIGNPGMFNFSLQENYGQNVS